MESKYYLVVAWYVPKENPENKPYWDQQPMISNVVYVDCKYHSKTMVETQFYEYFNAYYKKSVGAKYTKSINVWEYDSSDKAEKSRRKWITITNNSKYWVFRRKVNTPFRFKLNR
jgi:hypothetical protein